MKKLKILAEHLIHGKFNRDHFDMSIWYARDYHKNVGGKLLCGTAGCAIGECPFIFPEDWEYVDKDSAFGLPTLKHPYPELGTVLEKASWYFDITFDEASSLFMPKTFGQSEHVTREQVGENILKFIANKEKAT